MASDLGIVWLDLAVEGSTTADIRDVRYARWLASSVSELFALDDLAAFWVPPGAKEPRRKPWAALADDEIASIYELGGIALSDPGEEIVDAALSWHRVPGAEGGPYAGDAPPMNTLSLSVHMNRLAEQGFKEAFVGWCCEVARELELAYLVAFNRRAFRVRVPHARGLEAGLRDVYWLNVFGREFCELIGVDRLLSAPAARTEQIGPEHVLVVADDRLLEPAPSGDPLQPSSQTRALVEPIIAHIGREFFVTPPPLSRDPFVDAPAVMGPLQGLRYLLKSRRHQRRTAPAVAAQRRPSFDYSAIVADEDS